MKILVFVNLPVLASPGLSPVFTELNSRNFAFHRILWLSNTTSSDSSAFLDSILVAGFLGSSSAALVWRAQICNLIYFKAQFASISLLT